MIELDRLTKIFEGPQGEVPAVCEVSLRVPAGEICVFLGPSGCGKTTTLKMINRLIEPTSGSVFLNGEDTGKVNPITLRRSIGYVIQQIGLFPNKTVGENICVVPDLLGWDRRRARARAAELLEMVGLAPDSFMDRFPNELSGGQQQRVGVVRALAADPPVMLMDEPFGAIDPINRAGIQDEFLRMQERLKKTIILVSHDLDEAIKMADRIAIFRSGKLQQYATPSDLLAEPANEFVQDFLGSDRALKRLSVISVASAMLRDVVTVSPEDPVANLEARSEHPGREVAVCLDDAGRPIGMVKDLQLVPSEGPVKAHMQAAEPVVQAGDDLRTAVSSMLAQGTSLAICADEAGRFVGLLTWREVVAAVSGREASI